ncbi:hypothetical protein AVEN_275738-1 [Araneus ventricosus]|uniref:Tc1-like transposase DDE domain-containing protein n=1 Tax=Araneus ventricosus TaxID=182803 RepID=A0A4Y2LT55_ARAVE|nr:hypothetical protein AVEN_275738-1 [Araneus ventricosus]
MDEWKRVAWSDFSFITSMVVSGYAVCQAKCCSPSCTADHIQAGGGGIMLWGTFSWTALGPDNTPCRKARIVLEWFEEHTDEFQLMSSPPNSPDLNPMENISDVMERLLRAQTPPCPNISTLRDRCLDIWYNLSPVMYQKLVASMPRRVAAVLKAKGGATRY